MHSRGAVLSTDLIDNERDLAACLVPDTEPVALDTEFIRTNTFYPIPALYQIACGDAIGLVDAQADMSFEPLSRLLTDPSRLKVMHAFSEDLAVIDRHLGIAPVNLIDTQVAHAFLRPEYSIGYAALVERYLGTVLDQHATRSNWLQRPLTPEQITYAKEDVLYLLPVWHAMQRQLEDQGRLAWFFEEMQRHRPEVPPEQHYRTLSGISGLSGRGLAVLKSLVTWREREARIRDLPRMRTVRDEHLVEIAKRSSLTPDALREMLPKSVARRYGDALLDAFEQGRAAVDLPEPLPKRLGRRQEQQVQQMRQVVVAHAERLDLARELLAPRRDIVTVCRYYGEHRAFPDWFGAWRAEILGSEFIDILESGKK